jgi:hypothetical protein
MLDNSLSQDERLLLKGVPIHQPSDTLPKFILRTQLAASVSEQLSSGERPVMDNHEFLVNDLRNRIDEGEDISAEEMLVIVNSIRRGRRAAAPAAQKAARTKRTAGAASAPEDLTSLLDQGM